jgi:5-methylcytosine-specific restriction endonuclease McrA
MPFTIRLIDRLVENSVLQPLTLKLDPGSKVTGLAIVRISESVDAASGEIHRKDCVITLAEIVHRGKQISEALTARRAMRRTRRARNTRYREARFLNRGGDKTGWLAPSLMHRVNAVENWVKRLKKLAPITQLSQELVKFDMQKMQAQAEGQDISGVEYSQGELFGYEVKEYLLEKFQRQCMYCSAKDKPLEVEHLIPKSKGGSNRISNLGLACSCCNQKKGAKSLEEFVKDKTKLAKIKKQVKAPLKDAAAVNATRWKLFGVLQSTGLPVSTGTGAQTKFNRKAQGIAKTHALDAVCVGEIGTVTNSKQPTLQIKCTGRGSYQRTRLNQFGFPRGFLMRQKSVSGFATGDMVKATVPTGKKVGAYTGRVAVRASGSFNIQTRDGVVQGISHKHCKQLQRSDGYGYNLVAFTDAIGTPPRAMDASHPRSTSPA